MLAKVETVGKQALENTDFDLLTLIVAHRPHEFVVAERVKDTQDRRLIRFNLQAALSYFCEKLWCWLIAAGFHALLKGNEVTHKTFVLAGFLHHAKDQIDRGEYAGDGRR